MLSMALRRDADRGFTLIELLIALIIIALLLVLAMPSFFDFLENQRVRARAESLMTGLQLARTDAVRLNTNVTFMLTTAPATPDTIAGMAADAAGAHWAVRGLIIDPVAGTETMTLLNSHNAAEGQLDTTTTVAATTGAVIFGPFGNSLNAAAEVITVGSATGACASAADAHGARCLNIEVPTSGQVRMCDPLAPVGDTRECLVP